MKKPLLSNTVVPVLLGLFAVFVTGLLVTVLRAIFARYIVHLPIEEFQTVESRQPYVIILFILKIASFSSLFFGGAVAGYKAKRNGWLNGAMVGIILVIFSLGLVVIYTTSLDYISTSSFPREVLEKNVSKFYAKTLKNIPYDFFLPLIGGVVGQFLHLKNAIKIRAHLKTK